MKHLVVLLIVILIQVSVEIKFVKIEIKVDKVFFVLRMHLV